MQKFIYLITQILKVREKGYYRHYLQNHCLLLMLGITSLVTMCFVHQNGIKKNVEQNNCRQSSVAELLNLIEYYLLERRRCIP